MSRQEWRIHLSRPAVDQATRDRVMGVLLSPQLSMGDHLEEFESAFANKLGAPHAVAVSSGTAALHLSVRLLGLGPSDEGLTSPFSFVASANCLIFEGARPVFADVDPDYFTLDLDAMEASLSPRTRVVLPVHVFGNPVDMVRVMDFCKSSGLWCIEDACEALGGMLEGRALGTWGDLGVFGFYPNKQITSGEGGMVVVRRKKWDERLRSLRNQGRSPSGDGSFTELGYNYRLPELSAALGRGQVACLDELLQARREREACYVALLAELEELRVPPIAPGRSPFVFLVQTHEPGLRDRLVEDLAASGIQTAVYFRPIHLEPFYREKFGYRDGQFPRAEHAGRTCLAIPFHPNLTEGEQEEVVRAIRSSVTSWLKGKGSPVVLQAENTG